MSEWSLHPSSGRAWDWESSAQDWGRASPASRLGCWAGRYNVGCRLGCSSSVPRASCGKQSAACRTRRGSQRQWASWVWQASAAEEKKNAKARTAACVAPLPPSISAAATSAGLLVGLRAGSVRQRWSRQALPAWSCACRPAPAAGPSHRTKANRTPPPPAPQRRTAVCAR